MTISKELLTMALSGYRHQRYLAEEKIAAIERELNPPPEEKVADKPLYPSAKEILDSLNDAPAMSGRLLGIEPKKRHISAKGRRSIAAAQHKRWAKQKKAKA